MAARNYSHTFRYPAFTRGDGGRMPNTFGWQDRHMAALRAPMEVESAVSDLIVGWAQYADRHRARYESGIGEDGVLGPAWAAIGASIRALLNGETGRLDCGTLDGFICDTLTAEGFDPDGVRA